MNLIFREANSCADKLAREPREKDWNWINQLVQCGSHPATLLALPKKSILPFTNLGTSKFLKIASYLDARYGIVFMVRCGTWGSISVTSILIKSCRACTEVVMREAPSYMLLLMYPVRGKMPVMKGIRMKG
ncbi:hypothetical protein QQ045_017178 [Rhodiola kirilowii]